MHSDVCGPMPKDSWGGARYFITFIDDFSRKIFIYFMKRKSEAFDMFKTFKSLVENQTDRKIKKLRTDNGTEYMNDSFEHYLKCNGIIHQTTVPYTPQQNGVAERTNRTLVEKARCLMHEAGCNERMWAESVNTSAYLKNRSPHKAVCGTPEEIWSGKKVDLGHLKVFGCVVQALVPKELRKKIDATSKSYIFVGYCEETKGYRLFYINKSGKIVKARDVVFFENKFNSKSLREQPERIWVQLDANENRRQDNCAVQLNDCSIETENEHESDNYDSCSETEEFSGVENKTERTRRIQQKTV